MAFQKKKIRACEFTDIRLTISVVISNDGKIQQLFLK